jgi:hypothetical protein
VTYELHTLTGTGHNKLGPFMDDITDWSSAFLYEQVIAAGASVGGSARPPLMDWQPAEAAPSSSASGALWAGSTAGVAAVGGTFLALVWRQRRRRSG